MKRSLLLAAACVVLGCNAVAGINQPVDDGTGVVPPAVDGGTVTPPGTEPVSRFVGGWSTTTEQQQISGCGQTKTASNVAVSFTLVRLDAKSFSLSPDAAPQCQLTYNVSEDVATAATGASCSFTGTDATGSPQTQTYTYQPPTSFTLTSTETAEVRFRASVTADTAPGVVCLFDSLGTYGKTGATP